MLQVQKQFTPETRFIVGCAAGLRSARACELLEPAGFSNLVNMDGGFSGRCDEAGRTVVAGWVERGFPVLTNATEGHSYADLTT